MSAVFAVSAMPAETKGATAGKEKIAKTSKGANKNVGKSGTGWTMSEWRD